MSELRDKKYGDANGKVGWGSRRISRILVGQVGIGNLKNYNYTNHFQDLSSEKAQMCETLKEFIDISLDDLEVIATLGVGGFGRVELVKSRNRPGSAFALKCLKKQHIVETQQQEHVFSEKNILMSCKHNFITR